MEITRRDRRAMALVLVLIILCLLGVFGGIWYVLLRSEMEGTDQMTKHLVATLTGDSVAAQITALVDRWPWTQRFHMKTGQALTDGGERFFLYFDDTSPLFQGDAQAPLGPLGRSSWGQLDPPTFDGTITDLEAPRAYRIILRVKFLDEVIFMTWDRVWKQGILGSLNGADGAVETRTGDGSDTDLGRMIDETRRTARAHMGSGPQEQQVIEDLDLLEAEVRSGKNPAEVLFP